LGAGRAKKGQQKSNFASIKVTQINDHKNNNNNKCEEIKGNPTVL